MKVKHLKVPDTFKDIEIHFSSIRTGSSWPNEGSYLWAYQGDSPTALTMEFLDSLIVDTKELLNSLIELKGGVDD